MKKNMTNIKLNIYDTISNDKRFNLIKMVQ